MKKSVEFIFSCNDLDVRFMKELIKKIFNLPKMVMMVVISSLTTIALFKSIDGNITTYPILIFSSIVSLAFFYFFISTAFTRPSLLKIIEESVGNVYHLAVHGSTFTLSINEKAPISFGIDSIRNQFWQDSRYYLHIDSRAIHTFICIPVNEDTFDNLYGLANGLERRKKRLIVIKNKEENNEK